MFDIEKTNIAMTPITSVDELMNGMVVFNKAPKNHGFAYIYKDKEDYKILSTKGFPSVVTNEMLADNKMFYISGHVEFDSAFEPMYRTISEQNTLYRLNNDNDFLYFRTNNFIKELFGFNTIKIYVGSEDVFIGRVMDVDYTNPIVASALGVR